MSGSDDDLESRVGSAVNEKYRIDRLIGRGGMGAVYQATHLTIGKRVALKFLDRQAARDADSATRFQREAEAASAVESAHIVQIFDSGKSEDGLPFLVMELLQGEDLRARLRREGRLELDEALHVAAQVLRALARAHEAGIVHRDLKPENVFLCRRDDDPMFVKVVDFGISKLARRATADTLTRRGTVLGTAFYMSPEQAQAFRDLDGRTDLYSLGAILYESLSGRPPHVGTAYEAVLIDICTKDAEDLRVHAPQVPEAVARVVARALERDRDRRFRSAEEFHDTLAEAAPEFVDTSSARRGRPLLSSKPSAAPAQPTVLEPAEKAAPLGTAEGTAVRPSPALDARTARRRTIVTALVAALGAFALTAFLMARARSPSGAPAQPRASAASVPAAAIEVPRVTGPVVASASASTAQEIAKPAPSASGEVRRMPTSPTVAVRPRQQPAQPPEGVAPPGTAGVAGGLKLNTKGP